MHGQTMTVGSFVSGCPRSDAKTLYKPCARLAQPLYYYIISAIRGVALLLGIGSCVSTRHPFFLGYPSLLCGESMASPCSVVNLQPHVSARVASLPPLGCTPCIHDYYIKPMLASPRGVAHGRGPRLAPRFFNRGTKQGCDSTSLAPCTKR